MAEHDLERIIDAQRAYKQKMPRAVDLAEKFAKNTLENGKALLRKM